MRPKTIRSPERRKFEEEILAKADQVIVRFRGVNVPLSTLEPNLQRTYLGKMWAEKGPQEEFVAERAKAEKQSAEPNYNKKCTSCGSVPTVGNFGLCGPCCFGEADTAGGNW